MGLLLAAQPAGAVLGALVLARLVTPDRRLRLMGPMAVLSCLPLLGCAANPGTEVTLVLWALSPPRRSWVARDGRRITMTLTDETVQIAGNGPARQLTVYEHGVPALWAARGAFGAGCGVGCLGQRGSKRDRAVAGVDGSRPRLTSRALLGGGGMPWLHHGGAPVHPRGEAGPVDARRADSA